MQAKTFDTLLFVVLVVIALSSLWGARLISASISKLVMRQQHSLVVQCECPLWSEP